MEQYEISPRTCNKVIQAAIQYFEPEFLFVRWVGSEGGKIEVAERLQGKRLDVRHLKSGFEFLIDGVSRFLFKFSTSPALPRCTLGKRWSFAYERFAKRGAVDVIWTASTGYPYLGAIYTGPDDPRLPEPRSTVLRSVNDTHLAELTFKGKIPIMKTGQKMSGVWEYYAIDTSRLPQKPLEPCI
jgi:hypothetical protein